MEYAALKGELALAAYAGMTDQQAADALNASTIAVTVDIPINDLEGYLLLQRLLPELLAAAGTDGTDDATLAAKALAGLINSPRLTIVQTSVPDVMTSFSASVTALLTASQITPAQHDGVLALAASTTSRARQLLGVPVTVGDIQTAKAQ